MTALPPSDQGFWRPASEEDRPRVETLLAARAAQTVGVWDRVFREERQGGEPWHRQVRLWSRPALPGLESRVEGLLWTNAHGLIMPAFLRPQGAVAAAAQPLDLAVRPFALVGPEADCRPFLYTWEMPRHSSRYHTLACTAPPGGSHGAPGDRSNGGSHGGPGSHSGPTAHGAQGGADPPLAPPRLDPSRPWKDAPWLIRVATPDDLDELLVLEEAYQHEEVLVPGMTWHALGSEYILKEQIRAGWILVLESSGMLVAKAHINAWCPRWAQIGGVFVRPAYRGQGLGHLLMTRLGALLQDEGWNMSLFVRQENSTAIRIYKKNGFSAQGDFSIAYY